MGSDAKALEAPSEALHDTKNQQGTTEPIKTALLDAAANEVAPEILDEIEIPKANDIQSKKEIDANLLKETKEVGKLSKAEERQKEKCTNADLGENLTIK